MSEFVDAVPVVPLLVAVVACFVAVWMHGDSHGHATAHLYLTPRPARPAASVDPYAHIPTREVITPRRTWGDTQAAILLARVEALETRVADLEDTRDELAAEVVKFRGLAVEKDRLRRHWLRLFRIERARVRYAFGDLWDRRRKPSREKVAGIVLQFPTERARLVPPVIVQDFLEASAA